jgi:hypothetical protein
LPLYADLTYYLGMIKEINDEFGDNKRVFKPGGAF